jgi:DNA-directed RNA polymerase II subunit RPB1
VDVVKSVQICFDPNDNATTIVQDKLLMEQYYEFENMVNECLGNETNEEDESGVSATTNTNETKSKWIIRMELDAESLLDKNITMDDIHFAICNSYGSEATCVYSDYNSSNLIFRIRLNSSVFNKKKQKGVPETLDQSDEIYMLRNFQEQLLNNIVLRGVQRIKNVIARKLQNYVIKEEGKYVKKDIWVLDTTGTNLMSIMALDYIDNTRTFSNDIKEIFDVLGIEAARQIIFNEFVEVMEFSGGVYINYHHLSLLCDRMTSTKDMVPIFRSGLLNDDVGPIAKATFEVHTEVFLNAARHADLDHMRGVSANVMCGQYGYYGTNAFNLLLDIKEMSTLGDTVVNISDTNKEIDKLFSIKNDVNEGCLKNSIAIRNNITNIRSEENGLCDDDYDMGF